MAKITVRYRKLIPGRRHPLAGFDDKVRDTGGEIKEDKDHVGVKQELDAPKEADPEKNCKVRFLHWVVTGAAGFEPGDLDIAYGAKSTIIWNRELTILADKAPVVATAWYYLDDGSANGLTIDAFDGDLGVPVPNEDFVTVDPDSLTFNANETGFVPTDEQVNIHAYEELYKAPPQVPFLKWWVKSRFEDKPVSVNTTANSSGRTLTATAGSNGFAYAYYLTPAEDTDEPRYPIGNWEEPLIYVWLHPGVPVDGGPGGPWGPWGPAPGPWAIMSKDLATGLTLAAVAGLVKPELRGDILDLAARRLSQAASNRRSRVLGVLSSVVSASVGALTLQLFQTADSGAKALVAILGTAAAAAIGYFLPDVLKR